MPDNSDILWDADIDASGAIQVLERIEAQLDQVNDAAVQGFEGIDRQIEKSSKKMGILAGVVGGITAKLVEMGLQAAASIKNFVGSSIQLAARLDVLDTVLARVGTQAGYSEKELADFEQRVKSNGITTEAARQSMLLMIRANIDLEHATNLARIAQNAAVIAGINSSQAFERLITGIQKGEPELLDELQITLDRERAYGALATQLGKNVKQLTEAEKQEAVIQSIYKQSANIIGVYEDAMGDAGKQAGSLARYVDTLKETIGRAFQPAYSEQISFMTETLKDLNDWVIENEEGLQQFADVVTALAKVGFPLLKEGILAILEIPGTIKDVGVGLAEIINNTFGLLSEEELQRRISNLAKYAKDALLLIGTLVVGIVSSVINFATFLGRTFKEIFNAKDFEEFSRHVNYYWDQMTENIRNDMLDTSQSMVDSLYGVEEQAEATAEAVAQIPEALIAGTPVSVYNQADQMFQDEMDRREEARAKRWLRDERAATERAIRESWSRQDIERKFQDGIDNIEDQAQEKRSDAEEDYQEARRDAAKDHSEALIQIEEDYQERLKNIQENFEFEAGEFARKRDAVGLLRLIRQKKREEQKANEAREKARKKADKDYAEQLKDLEENYKKIQEEIEEASDKQLESLEKAREKDYENLERSLERQQYIRDLHAQWEFEDIQAENLKKEQEMGTHFGNLEGITVEGFNNLRRKWDEYFGDTTEMNAAFIAAIIAQYEASGVLDALSPGADMIGVQEFWDWWNKYQEDSYTGTPGDPNYVPPTPDHEPPDDSGDTTGTQEDQAYRDWYEYYIKPWQQWMERYPLLHPWEFVNEQGNPNDYWDQFLAQDPSNWFPNVMVWPRHYMGNPYDPYTKPSAWYQWQANEGVIPGPAPGGPIGQAGQVSMLLANALKGGLPLMATGPEPARLPPASPSTTVDRREIHVTADLMGVDPYLQQQVINTLYEIERNRGSGP